MAAHLVQLLQVARVVHQTLEKASENQARFINLNDKVSRLLTVLQEQEESLRGIRDEGAILELTSNLDMVLKRCHRMATNMHQQTRIVRFFRADHLGAECDKLEKVMDSEIAQVNLLCGLRAKKDAFLIHQEVENTRREMLEMFRTLREQAESTTQEEGEPAQTLELLSTEEEVLGVSDDDAEPPSRPAIHRDETVRPTIRPRLPSNITPPRSIVREPESFSEPESEDEMWGTGFTARSVAPQVTVAPWSQPVKPGPPSPLPAFTPRPKISPESSLGSSDGSLWNISTGPSAASTAPRVAGSSVLAPPPPPAKFRHRSARSSFSSNASSGGSLWGEDPTRTKVPPSPAALHGPTLTSTPAFSHGGGCEFDDTASGDFKRINFEDPPPAFEAVAGLDFTARQGLRQQYCTMCMTYLRIEDFPTTPTTDRNGTREPIEATHRTKMKRSYGQTSGGPQPPGAQYQYQPAQPAQGLPPLPPGPPPPPPAAPNPYAAYGYGGQPYQPPQAAAVPQATQAAAHPQYPGYGYGGQAAQPAAAPTAYPGYYAQQPGQAQANGYAAGAYSQPQAAAPLPAAPSGIPANPYGAYGNAQNYAAAVATANQQQAQAYPAYSQPATPSPYGTPAAPTHYPQQPAAPMQYQQHQQPAAYPGGPPPMGASPQGAPPFKRTRYDSMGAPQGQPPMGMGQPGSMGPPPALPPLNSGGPGGFSDRNGSTRGRGGYGGPPPIRGGPAIGRGGYMGSPTHSSDGYGGSGQSYPSPGGLANGAGRGGGSAGSYRGGRGGGDMGRPTVFDSRGAGRAALPPPPFPRGGPGVGPPASAPFGPSSARTNDRNPSRSARGAFDARGRPLSGLPGGGRGGSAYGRGSDYRAAATYDAPKGPRSATRPSSGRDAGSSQPRKERKWGKDPAQPNGRDDVKRTLTDFRISGLDIPEIEWEWKAEVLQAVVKTIVEAAEAAETAEPEPVEPAPEASSAADVAPVPVNAQPESPATEKPTPAPEVPAPSSPEKPSVDMSIDEINPADLEDAAASEDAPSDVKPDIATASSPETKKKLTKKEKNAQAAAKRAATALAKKEAAAAAAAAEAGDEVKNESDERADSPAAVRKDGKHGRDDEEESLVITDNTAKKVKPDTGEVITLESLGLDMDGVETIKPATDAPVVPAAPVVPTGPKSLAIPTGPAADANRSTPAPPTNRENSRLRIYFASPVSSVSTYSAPPASERARSVEENTEPPASTAPSIDGTAAIDDASEATSTQKAADRPAEPESAPDAEGVKEEDDDVDGVAFEVDGQTVPEAAAAPDTPVTLTIPVDDSDDDSDEVQSALLDVKPRPDGEAAGPDASATGAPVLPGENAAYPPNPYPTEDAVHLEAANDAATPAEPELMPPEPSADRISISYARNTRRMVLDADVVDKVTIFRAEGRIELSVAIHPATLGNDSALDEFRICRGILVEALDPENDDYIVIDRASLELAWRQQAAEQDPAEPTEQAEPTFLDPLLPPLHHLLAEHVPTAVNLLQREGLSVSAGFNKTHITIVATLDRQNPLTEARWVKTGEVEPWIASLNLATDKKESVSEWRGKITISDPDPPPTIQQALEAWAQSSTVGTLDERNGFVSGHMADIDNVFEILLRLTRGDRAGPSYHAPAMQPSSVGALAATLSAPYAEHQTQVSLAVLAMFRLSVETAAKAGIPQKEVEKQVGEIVRTIPYHLIFKSLDGMFREQKKRS